MSRAKYSSSTTTVTRHLSGHGTSSAFSSSANPDEDWTKISDLAERRRIQNRIAQRNYRKKLKKRLEDLERRAESSSASSPHVSAELHTTKNIKTYQRSPENQREPSPRMMPSQYTPPMEDNLMFPTHYEREGSRTPPLFAYQHIHPAPEEVYPPYPQSQPYHHAVTTAEYRDYTTAPVPSTLPSIMQFHESLKSEDGTLNPFHMYSQGLPAIDIQSHHSYEDSNPHTPPLSHSYEHSDSGYQYPTTPLSMSPSPRMMTQI